MLVCWLAGEAVLRFWTNCWWAGDARACAKGALEYGLAWPCCCCCCCCWSAAASWGQRRRRGVTARVSGTGRA